MKTVKQAPPPAPAGFRLPIECISITLSEETMLKLAHRIKMELVVAETKQSLARTQKRVLRERIRNKRRKK